MRTAAEGDHGPMAIRYPRGKGTDPDPCSTPVEELTPAPIGRGERLRDGSELCIRHSPGRPGPAPASTDLGTPRVTSSPRNKLLQQTFFFF